MALTRRTENWTTYIAYKHIDPNYRADVGFAVKNDRKWITLLQSHNKFWNEGFLKKMTFLVKKDILYDFNNSRCESANGNGYVSNDLLGRINLNIECRNGKLIAILKKNRISVGQVRLYDNYVETEISKSVLPWPEYFQQ